MSPNELDKITVRAIEQRSVPMGGAMSDYDPIIEAARGRHFILVGEASHGTQDFYRARAELTRRLITELGFDAVVVEADWPDAYAVNRYVTGEAPALTAEDALKHFERFPTWMWGNEEVLGFIRWLRAYNGRASRDLPVRFYGLDLYSMSTSAHAVIEYLAPRDPAAAQRARRRYGCMADFIHKPQIYGRSAEFGITESCEHEITAQLIDLQHKAYRYMAEEGIVDGEEYFCAEQNAKLVQNAEEYYRAMFRSRANSWNVRDRHMFSTLGDIVMHLSQRLGRPAKLVVWAHNSHLGNAAATEMAKRGDLNIGQLVRETHSDDALLIGFTTSMGEVTAASDWDAKAERKRIRPPLEGSYERLFHEVNHKRFVLDLTGDNAMTDLLLEPRLERAIGVIYRPETERASHYFTACLPEQFDFIIHFDETQALRPLDIPVQWHDGEMDETYPSGL